MKKLRSLYVIKEESKLIKISIDRITRAIKIVKIFSHKLLYLFCTSTEKYTTWRWSTSEHSQVVPRSDTEAISPAAHWSTLFPNVQSPVRRLLSWLTPVASWLFCLVYHQICMPLTAYFCLFCELSRSEIIQYVFFRVQLLSPNTIIVVHSYGVKVEGKQAGGPNNNSHRW